MVAQGLKTFDGSLKDFTQILGPCKSLTFRFSGAWAKDEEGQKREAFLKDFSPRWNDQRTELQLQVPNSKLTEVARDLLTFPNVIDFSYRKNPY